jgi:hypothetical protein
MDRQWWKTYFRLRLFGISDGVSLLGFDILVTSTFKQILRVMCPFFNKSLVMTGRLALAYVSRER